MFKDLSTDSDENLLEWLANAATTGAGCLGHHKGEMNKRYASSYEEELLRRGIKIPAREELYEVGVFNGPGSF